MAIFSDCPWDLLFPKSVRPGSLHHPPPNDASKSFQVKSFVQALNNSCSVPMSQLPKPCLKLDELSIKIPESEYIAGLESCKTHFHGRLLLSKGNVPLKLDDLRGKLLSLWKEIGPWKIISLGKGFYEFSFSSLDDARSVLAIGLWNLGSGSLRVFSWTKDFSPYSLKQTHAQVWVRFYGIPQEYWGPKILFTIASGLGVPICLDEATNKKTFGHFARVLIDLDLNSNLGIESWLRGNILPSLHLWNMKSFRNFVHLVKQ